MRPYLYEYVLLYDSNLDGYVALKGASDVFPFRSSHKENRLKNSTRTLVQGMRY